MAIMSKLIFLDIDGILNDHTKLESGYCGIDRDKASRLNRLLDTVPDSYMVITSAWRYMMTRGAMTHKGFEHLLCIGGVKAHNRLNWPHACTREDPEGGERALLEGIKWREDQIKQYIDEHTPDKYVVLDDLPLTLENFIKVDGAVGLTDNDVDMTIAILKGGTP